MRNLAEPSPRFWAAAPNHPEALLEEPQAFQAVGEKKNSPNKSQRSTKNKMTKKKAHQKESKNKQTRNCMSDELWATLKIQSTCVHAARLFCMLGAPLAFRGGDNSCLRAAELLVA